VISRSKVNIIVIMMLVLVGCTSSQKLTYKENFPDPCTASWFVEIERQVLLVNPETGRPRAGSPQWLASLDEKFKISSSTSTEIGDIEWCHQVHQQFIGL